MTSYIAQQALKSQTNGIIGGLDEPLLGGYDSNTADGVEGVEDGAEKFKKKGFTKMDGLIAAGLAAVVVVVGGAMATVGYGVAVMYTAGSVALATVPLVGWQRTQIVDTRGLRDFINEIRNTVNQFAETNKKITANIDQLEQETSRLGETEAAFQSLAEKQGQSVGELVRLVKENGENIIKMKAIMKGETSQLLIRTVMQGDMNEDYHVDAREVEFLILRLQQVEFIKFDEERLRKVIADNNGDMDCIMKLALEIFDDDIPEEAKLFQILEPSKPSSLDIEY